VLEADAPVGALDAVAIRLDAHGPEEVEFPFTRSCIAAVYAVIGVHGEASYANLRQASSPAQPINTGICAELCRGVPSYAKGMKSRFAICRLASPRSSKTDSSTVAADGSRRTFAQSQKSAPTAVEWRLDKA
jgi:hypothetical protein